MPTTTDPSNAQLLPAKIDGEPFGDLIKLPGILEEARASVSAARVAVEKTLQTYDLTTADVLVLDEYDAALNKLGGRLKQTSEKLEGKRMPHTREMNRIISLFTAEEKNFDDWLKLIATDRNRIAVEKRRRIQAADQERAKEIAAENQRIEDEKARRNGAVKMHSMQIVQTCERMRNLFYADVEKFAVVAQKPITEYDFGYEDLDAEYMKQVAAVRDDLVEKIESRRREVKEIAAGNAEREAQAEQRRQQETETLKKQAAERLTQQQDADHVVAESEKLKSSFEIHSKAEPVVQQASGTRSKKKFKVTGLAGYLLIMQYWTNKVLPGLTDEEREKKLSFMVTAANAALNSGAEIPEGKGLVIEEDIKTTIKR